MEKIQEAKDICKEVFTILAYFDEELIEKIPPKIMGELMKIAADSEIDYYIDVNKNLEEQNISEESKNLISLIYYSYIADENEKTELIDIWNKNEKKYQEEINEKYNYDSLFKKRKEANNCFESTNELKMVEYKESLINKIIRKIKNIFSKK